MKGDLLSSQFLVLCKQKHNSDDDMGVIIHYNKHSYMYNIPFLTLYNKKSDTLDL